MVDFLKLNEAQKSVVTSTEGPTMVLAGAGSGKTRTLVAKINYLLEEKKIGPYQILALTFSNKAAREMRERVSSEVGIDVGALKITTFHSFCVGVLRSEANYLGLSKSFTIYDDSESKSIVKSILGRRGISPKELSPYEILYYIDDLSNKGYYKGRIIEDNIDKDDEFFSYYEEYISELHKSNAVDFGGLITGVLELFEKYPKVLEKYQNRYKYILVDEYQDTNRAQFDLVKMLAGERRNICVVGDEDQSIYSWRGADIRNILDFEKVYPDVRLIKLEQNYRSSKTIIDAASCVISKNEMRKGKSMWTSNSEGEVLQVVECSNEKKEADYISTEIQKLINSGVDSDEIAIFYRANSQSRIIEDKLRASQIPYRVVGGVRFYDRKEIKDLLAYLKVIINGKDSLALSRIINVPARGIGATTLRKLEFEALRTGLSLWELIENFVENIDNYKDLKLSAKIKKSLSNFVFMIQELKVMDNENVVASIIYEKILHDSGYLEALKAKKDYESMARIENLDEFLNAIVQYEESYNNKSLSGFLETVVLDNSSIEDEAEKVKEVSLMTVHGSKGLEFHYVFLAGAEENTFPSYKSLESGDIGVEEERRLFYVAMTRAMKRLYILFAQARMLFGQLKFNGPSRFIDEIPEEYYLKHLVNDHSFHQAEFEQDSYKKSKLNEYDNTIVYESRSSYKYPKGVKVRHALYGVGTVLESEGNGNEEKVTIRFLDGARKKFIVKFAPLALV